MANDDKIPEWALAEVRARLRANDEIINAQAYRMRLTQIVLLNTSGGAAVVTKPLFGSSEATVLSYPQGLLEFRCEACARRNFLADARAPADVYCAACGKAQHVDSAGQSQAPRQAAKRRASKPPAATSHEIAARRPVRKAASRKTSTRKAKARTTTTRKVTTRKTTTRKTTARQATHKRPSRTRTTKKTAKLQSSPLVDRSASDFKPQCAAITPRFKQCRNSARGRSKYCGSHKGYRPPAKAVASRAVDTLPRVRGAKDTMPAGRKRTRAPSNGS